MSQVPSSSLAAASRLFSLLPKSIQLQISCHQIIPPPLIAVTCQLLGPPHAFFEDAQLCLPTTLQFSSCLASFTIHMGAGSPLAAHWNHLRSFKKILMLESHRRFCLHWPEVPCSLGIRIVRCSQGGSQVHLRLRNLSFSVPCPPF